MAVKFHYKPTFYDSEVYAKLTDLVLRRHDERRIVFFVVHRSRGIKRSLNRRFAQMCKIWSEHRLSRLGSLLRCASDDARRDI
jgi:hypothetical protein